MRRAALLLACAIFIPACGTGSSSTGGGGAAPAVAPTGVTVTVGDGELTVAWNAVFEATRYTIYGATVSGVTPANALSLPGGMRIKNLKFSPRVIAGLTNGTTYYFIVTAGNGAGEGPPSSEASGTPVVLPAAPTGVTATAGNQSVQLDWTAVPFAASYNVYRATVPGVTPANYAGLAGGAKDTSVAKPFTASSLTNLTTYYFIVTALNALGESVGSTEVSAMPVPPPPPAPGSFTAVRGNGQVTLSWAAVGTATSYTVYGAAVTGVTPANYAGLAGGFRIQNATSPQGVSPLTNGTTYSFIVTASNPGGEGAASTEIAATPIPPPPAPTSPLAVGGDGKITVSWTASPTATSYVVYSAEVTGMTPANWSSLAGGKRVTVLGSPYERRGLTTGTTLYFVVSGVNDVGEGLPSSEVSAAPTGSDSSEMRLLSFRPIDAEYNRSNDTIVAVSSFPHRLNIYNPATHVNTAVGLSLAPTCVSIGPSGTFAAVGHDGWVSYVNLGTATLEQTFRVSTIANDIVLAANGFVYVMPAVDQSENIRCIQLSSGTETLSTGNSVYAGSYMKLHSGGTSIYGGNTGLSPADIERYSITGGTAAYVIDSPYHGDFPSGGPIWMSEDGLRLFTRPGSAFRTLPGAGGDMTYNGDLAQTGFIRSLDERTITGKIALIPEPGFSAPHEDTELQVYDDAFLAFDRRLPIPPFRANGNAWAAHGRFVFIHGDGTRAFVLAKADPGSRLNTSHGIAEVSLTGTGAPVPTGLTLRPSSLTSAQISWDLQPGATSYKVYWATVSGVLPGNYNSLPGGGTMTTAASTVSPSGLPSGATLYAVVTAVTAAGEGSPSPEVSLVLQASPSFASAVTGVTVTPGDGQLSLLWTPSSNATSYVLYGGRRPGATKDTYGTIEGGFRLETATPSVVLNSVMNDRILYFRIASRNANGDQGVSAEMSAIPTAATAPTLQALAYRVIDAEYSAASNRIISVSSSPSALHAYDPATQVDVAVALPVIPTCVSVSPDGLTAAVGHNGYISHVDLAGGTVLNTWSVAHNVADIVLAGTGKAYISTVNDIFLHAINLSTGTDTSADYFSTLNGTRIKLHVSGNWLYGGNVNVSPSDVEKHSITGVKPVRLYDSPYHGDFPMGGEPWLARSGDFLITRYGTRFSTTGVQATDILYQGRLAGTGTLAFADHSAAAGWIAAVPQTAGEDGRLHWLDDLYSETGRVAALPKFSPGGVDYPAHGKFVFFSADGTKVHVVVMADATSGLLNDYAVVTFD